ncbi:MAG: D-alanyl-lipoteichoic acid biosynthesis protein DltB [Acidobacteriaceae bacterium]|nr:D-alanyl-lipoteichoic acid biosynthesis protein DltB [Acidobacteriaceae bacterium]
MLFNSLQFAVFFPVVATAFFLLSQRWRVQWLLFVSCVFYMTFIPAYILVLLATVLIDYFAGIFIEKSDGSRRSLLLWVSILSTCIVLFVFKYYGFFTGSVVGMADLLGSHLTRPVVHIILPIGLSFHTFQSLSYVIEVYYRRQKAEKNFVVYATYVMFFPQLVAGPIERPQNLLHQFRERHDFNYAHVTAGLKRIAWGFFKKLVVADRLSLYVNDVYAAPRQFNGLQLTIATLFFAYQIYCDFSGYSDIAIGTAQVLGFRLMENFRTPYYSKSITEFWRRWHISLSTWFKDYVYIPLGGNRVPKSRHIVNLLITFTMSGLWHGANWTFVAWGALNGVYLVIGWLTQEWRDRCFELLGLTSESRLRQLSKWLSTFLLTCFAWILFRARSMADAAYVFMHLGRGWDIHAIATEQFFMRQFPVAIAAIVVLEIGQWEQLVLAPFDLGKMRAATRWTLYAGFVMAVVMFGVYKKAQFIYFQF